MDSWPNPAVGATTQQTIHNDRPHRRNRDIIRLPLERKEVSLSCYFWEFGRPKPKGCFVLHNHLLGDPASSKTIEGAQKAPCFPSELRRTIKLERIAQYCLLKGSMHGVEASATLDHDDVAATAASADTVRAGCQQASRPTPVWRVLPRSGRACGIGRHGHFRAGDRS